MNIPTLQAPDMAAPIRVATAGAQQAVGQIVEGATKFIETGKQQEDRNNFAKVIFENLDQMNGGQKGKWWKQYDVNNIKPGQEKEIADIAQEIAKTAQWEETLPPEQKQALAAPLDVNFMFNKYYKSDNHQKSLQNIIQGGINKSYDAQFQSLLDKGLNSSEIASQMPGEAVTALKPKFDLLQKAEEAKLRKSLVRPGGSKSSKPSDAGTKFAMEKMKAAELKANKAFAAGNESVAIEALAEAELWNNVTMESGLVSSDIAKDKYKLFSQNKASLIKKYNDEYNGVEDKKGWFSSMWDSLFGRDSSQIDTSPQPPQPAAPGKRKARNLSLEPQ